MLQRKPALLLVSLALGLSGIVAIIGCVQAGVGAADLSAPSGSFSAQSGGLGSPTGAFDAEFGATQGGVQDLGLARELVRNGRVPPAEAFRVEGMFSEHDLGVDGDACQRELCLRGALGIAPDLAGDPSGWFQLGLSSTIDPDNFVRPSLTLIACVDVSGSMSWGYGSADSEYPTPGELARALLRELAGQLGPDDRIAIVTFGSDVRTVLELSTGDSTGLIQAAIDGLSENGSTDMESGMRRAYELANAAPRDTDEVRVMVFSDYQPNVGATEPSEFEQMVQGGAAENVGMTLFAFGVGLSQQMVSAVSHLRGGNAFSLFERSDISALMEDSWPWLASPIAYDLHVSLATGAGFEIGTAYGFPPSAAGEAPSLEVATVFLSKNRGALLMQLLPGAAGDFTGMSVTANLSYDTPAGEPISETLTAAYDDTPLDDRGEWFEQSGVRKTVGLALLTEAMEAAAAEYGQDANGAVALLEDFIQRFEASLAGTDDTESQAELQFANDLLALMQAGAEQGDLYGQVGG